jgi:hypothetical protein
MINLRYHIVSITAVFLALGIGLTLGSTFLDRVTVDNLKDQLDEVEQNVRDTNARNAELNDQVTLDRERDEALAEQIPERLADGHVEDVPVLVIATDGTDEALVDRAISTLGGGGAEVAGTWWATDRWSLDDEDEIADLGEVLDLSSDQPDRLRRNAAIQLAEVLQEAAGLGSPAPPGPSQPGPDGEVAEPALVVALREAGFIEEETVSSSGDEPVLIPAEGARFVLVSSLPAEDPAQMFVQGLAAQLTIDGPAPVVAAQGRVELPAPDGERRDEETERTTFIGPLRTGEDVSERLSTIDDLDLAAGVAALVLATEDGDARTGHYGVGADATRLLPAPESE